MTGPDSIALARLSEGWCPDETHGRLQGTRGWCRDCSTLRGVGEVSTHVYWRRQTGWVSFPLIAAEAECTMAAATLNGEGVEVLSDGGYYVDEGVYTATCAAPSALTDAIRSIAVARAHRVLPPSLARLAAGEHPAPGTAPPVPVVLWGPAEQ